MSLNRYAVRRDQNEKEIIAALEAAGWHCWQLDRPADLLVWKHGQPFRVLEVKTPGARLRKDQQDQQEFLRLTGTPVVRTPDAALRAVGAIR